MAEKYSIYQLFRGGRVADSGSLVTQLESPIIALITHSGGRTLRSPGILDDHKAAGVDYHNDSQMSHNHSTAFPKRYQESDVTRQIRILKTYQKRCANHRFRDPE